MLGVLFALLVLAAILFPAFAQVKGGGRKFGTWTVAEAILNVRKKTGKWPVSFEEVAPQIKLRRSSAAHRIIFYKTAEHDSDADYAISVDGQFTVFKLDPNRGPSRIDKVAFGTLP